MNEKIFRALVDILQKQANAIRKLQAANIALMELARRNSDLPAEEFAQQLLGSLSAAEESGPANVWHRGIAREIEEIVTTLNLLDEKQKEIPN